MKHSEFEFKTFDGLSLFAQRWQPKNKTKAVVCLVHGMGEHIGRYTHVAAQITEKGYSLIAFDLRGHGQSEGPRGHTPSYEALLQDISSLLEVIHFLSVFINKRGNTISLRQQGNQTERNRKIKIPI